MDNSLVFTKKYKVSDFDGFLMTDEHIHHNDATIPIKALWDTGSSESVISSELAQKMNLQSIGKAYLNGTSLSNKSNIYKIVLLLQNKQRIKLEVTESTQLGSNGIDLLIGLDVITMCDFVISTYGETICLSVRFPSNGLIDFTKE